MSLHASLAELSEQAQACDNLRLARGILFEAPELLRNGLDHGSDPTALAEWFSGVIARLVASPAIPDPVALSGPFATGDGIPTVPVTLTGSAEARKLLIDAGLTVSTHRNPAPTLTDILALRPQAMHGPLPDKGTPIDFYADLVTPVILIAEVLGQGNTTSERLSTLENLRYPLACCRDVGLELALDRWVDNVSSTSTLGELTSIDRARYGEASRTLATVISHIEQGEE